MSRPAQNNTSVARIYEVEAYGNAPSGDLESFVYQLDTDKAPTTVAVAGNPTTISVTPSEDGTRTLTVRAKDKAANLSGPNTYRFNVGRAGWSSRAGANVVQRTKLAVEGDAPARGCVAVPAGARGWRTTCRWRSYQGQR